MVKVWTVTAALALLAAVAVLQTTAGPIHHPYFKTHNFEKVISFNHGAGHGNFGKWHESTYNYNKGFVKGNAPTFAPLPQPQIPQTLPQYTPAPTTEIIPQQYDDIDPRLSYDHEPKSADHSVYGSQPSHHLLTLTKTIVIPSMLTNLIQNIKNGIHAHKRAHFSFVADKSVSKGYQSPPSHSYTKQMQSNSHLSQHANTQNIKISSAKHSASRPIQSNIVVNKNVDFYVGPNVASSDYGSDTSSKSSSGFDSDLTSKLSSGSESVHSHDSSSGWNGASSSQLSSGSGSVQSYDSTSGFSGGSSSQLSSGSGSAHSHGSSSGFSGGSSSQLSSGSDSVHSFGSSSGFSGGSSSQLSSGSDSVQSFGSSSGFSGGSSSQLSSGSGSAQSYGSSSDFSGGSSSQLSSGSGSIHSYDSSSGWISDLASKYSQGSGSVTSHDSSSKHSQQSSAGSVVEIPSGLYEPPQ